MHEMSIAASILEMALQEAAAKNCARLIRVRVECGALRGIMPEALELCFRALVKGGPHAGASLEIVEIPLLLRCASCGNTFGGGGREALWLPCPACGQDFGHVIESGHDLVLSQVEAAES